jgi:hypothetical protein
MQRTLIRREHIPYSHFGALGHDNQQKERQKFAELKKKKKKK